MWGTTHFTAPCRRRPVFLGVRPPSQDSQGAAPRRWCLCCGSEVFSKTEDFCIRCRSILGGEHYG